jgi:hypothetical protein
MINIKISGMKKLKIMLTSIALVAGGMLYAQKPAVELSNEPGWKHIGHTTASFKTQNESVVVYGADEFEALKIKITEAPIHIMRMQVFYESGEMQDIDVNTAITADAMSPVFQLKHPDRDIQKIAFTYHSVPNADGEKADIDVYGLKTNQPKGSDSFKDEAKEAEEDVERAAENTERDLEKAADDVENEVEDADDDGNKNTIREGVNEVEAAIKDEKLEDKVGPNDETVYRDDNGKYYYINSDGKKVFITALQLKNKKDNN